MADVDVIFGTNAAQVGPQIDRAANATQRAERVADKFGRSQKSNARNTRLANAEIARQTSLMRGNAAAAATSARLQQSAATLQGVSALGGRAGGVASQLREGASRGISGLGVAGGAIGLGLVLQGISSASQKAVESQRKLTQAQQEHIKVLEKARSSAQQSAAQFGESRGQALRRLSFLGGGQTPGLLRQAEGLGPRGIDLVTQALEQFGTAGGTARTALRASRLVGRAGFDSLAALKSISPARLQRIRDKGLRPSELAAELLVEQGAPRNAVPLGGLTLESRLGGKVIRDLDELDAVNAQTEVAQVGTIRSGTVAARAELGRVKDPRSAALAEVGRQAQRTRRALLEAADAQFDVIRRLAEVASVAGLGRSEAQEAELEAERQFKSSTGAP